MKKIFTASFLVMMGFFCSKAPAGNPDRAGGAGATQLTVNPYARSSGIGGANTASVRGLESFYLNIGGLAYTEKTEFIFSRTTYLSGSNVFINNLGLAQSMGDAGVIGLSVASWDFGNIPITTYDQPDGTLGTYTLQVLNLGAAYSKKFSNSITGGLLVRYISEGIASVKADGIGLDAGVQYQTSLNPRNKIKKEDFRFAIAVRNIGPDMAYQGSGLSFKSLNQSTNADRKALMASQSFNLPALVNIGVAYDIRLDRDSDYYFHRLSICGNFNYNAFSSNVTGLGLEYAFRENFMVRGAYNYQEDNSSTNTKDYTYRTPLYGFWAGCTLQMPITAGGTSIGIDYAYAPTRFFSGMHTIGVRLALGAGKKR